MRGRCVAWLLLLSSGGFACLPAFAPRDCYTPADCPGARCVDGLCVDAPDGATRDATAPDADLSDARARDAESSDAARADASPGDASPSDAAPLDAGDVDGGRLDADADAGDADAGTAAGPCRMLGQTTVVAGREVDVPILVRRPSGFSIAYEQYAQGRVQSHLVLADPGGVATTSPLRLHPTVTSTGPHWFGPQLAWLDGAHHVVLHERLGRADSLQYLRVAADGLRVELDRRPPIDPAVGSLGANQLVVRGAELLLSWFESNAPRAELLRLDGAGRPLAASTPGPVGRRLRVVPLPGGDVGGTVGQWQALYASEEVVYFRGDPSGRPRAEVTLTSTSGHARFSDLAVGDGELGLVWTNDTSGTQDVYFQRVDFDGGARGPVVRVAEGDRFESQPRIVWRAAPREWAIAFQRQDVGVRSTVHLALVRGDAVVGPLQVNTPGGVLARAPSILVEGAGYAIAFADDALGLRLARLECP